MSKSGNITADAAALQERDEFREADWLKAIAPAKVNLHLAIGARRPDGYHSAVSIMHALALHDVLYLRPAQGDYRITVSPAQGVIVPEIDPEDNLARRAVVQLARALGLPDGAANLDIRIEKNIPMQAGLGGGSSDAAAALVGAVRLWGASPDDPRIEETARALGADVAFFLHGGCAALVGAGDEFSRSLAPSRRAVVLVKPDGGVSTAEAYRAFDDGPVPVPDDTAASARDAESTDEISPFNNLAPAAESLMPELADVRLWLESQPGTQAALLCGSGAATFATCDDFAAAARVAAAASARGWWSRATSFSSIRAAVLGADQPARGESTYDQRDFGAQDAHGRRASTTDVLLGGGA